LGLVPRNLETDCKEAYVGKPCRTPARDSVFARYVLQPHLARRCFTQSSRPLYKA